MAQRARPRRRARALWLERTEGYAEKFLDHQPLNPGDAIVIFGHRGRNASGIDTAIYAKKRGLTVVAVTASANLDKPATHCSGKRLADAADIVVDTGAPIEDAIVPIAGWSRPVAGSSTVLAMMMMHELIARIAQKLANHGVELPVFASPTIAGVTLRETDLIYGLHRERMVEAAQKHLPSQEGDGRRDVTGRIDFNLSLRFIGLTQLMAASAQVCGLPLQLTGPPGADVPAFDLDR